MIQYELPLSGLPQEVREKIPSNIRLITEASDYNLSVKVYLGNENNADVSLLLLQNKIAEPIIVTFARINLAKILDIDSYEYLDYPMVGDGDPLVRKMTPWYGRSYEMQPLGTLAALTTIPMDRDQLVGEVTYCIKSEYDGIAEGIHCKKTYKVNNQLTSHSLATPLYDFRLGKITAHASPATEIAIISDSNWSSDKGWLYVYSTDGEIDRNTPNQIMQELDLALPYSNGDVRVYHTVAAKSPKIRGFMYHVPSIVVMELPDEERVGYFFVVSKDKPNNTFLMKIDEILTRKGYSLKGTGEGMHILID